MSTEPTQTDHRKLSRLQVFSLIAVVGGMFVIPLIVLTGRWLTINPLVYVGIAFYVLWILELLRAYFTDRRKGVAPPIDTVVVTLLGSLVALWVMAFAHGAWALSGLALWAVALWFMDDSEKGPRKRIFGLGGPVSTREKHRRGAIWVFITSVAGLVVTLLAAPDGSLQSSFHPVQLLVVIFGLVAFYSFIQAINPGEMIGAYYNIKQGK